MTINHSSFKTLDNRLKHHYSWLTNSFLIFIKLLVTICTLHYFTFLRHLFLLKFSISGSFPKRYRFSYTVICRTLTAIIFYILVEGSPLWMAMEILECTMCRVRLCWLVILRLEVLNSFFCFFVQRIWENGRSNSELFSKSLKTGKTDHFHSNDQFISEL